jgi:Pentapeptide repeats (8 copies)
MRTGRSFIHGDALNVCALCVCLLCGVTLHAEVRQAGRHTSVTPKAAPVEAANTAAGQAVSPRVDGSESDPEMNKLKREELRAQQEYYQAQTEAISARPRLLWQHILPLFTALGALAAAIAAWVSFSFNYRATIRNQQDLRFYEALKRFGDKDSAAVRASAAGLLAELGAITRRVWLWTTGRPFLQVSLHQLTVGLLLEENSVVLEAIGDSLIELMALDAQEVLNKLYKQNLTLQKELTVALADFLAFKGSDQQGAIPDRAWQAASAECRYRPFVLQTLKTRMETHGPLGKVPFTRYLEDSRLRRVNYKPDNAVVAEALRDAGMRLRSNVAVLAEAIFRSHPESPLPDVFLCGARFGIVCGRELQIYESQLQDITGFPNMISSYLYLSEFQGANLYSANLEGSGLFSSGFEGATLSSVNLRNADLRRARLNGANLMDCKLDGAKLYGVQIDGTTSITGTNWWAADFMERGELDEDLLRKLHDRVLSIRNKYGSELVFGKTDPAKWLDEAEPAVRAFVEARQQEKS